MMTNNNQQNDVTPDTRQPAEGTQPSHKRRNPLTTPKGLLLSSLVVLLILSGILGVNLLQRFFKPPTASTKWSFQLRLPGRFDFMPVFVNGTIFVGFAIAQGGQLYALDAATGREKWVFQAKGDILSEPTVVNDIVYINSRNDNLYALDAATGQVKWTFDTGSNERQPAVANGVVYTNFYKSPENLGLMALDAVSGSPKWSFIQTVGIGLMLAPPMVSNKTVYASDNKGHFYALDAASGKKQWTFQTQGSVYSSPTVVNGTVYANSIHQTWGSLSGYLYALNASDGTQEWSFPTGGFNYGVSPTVINDTVYIGTTDNQMYAIDAASGTQKWSFQTKGQIYSSPTVLGNIVYVNAQDSYASNNSGLYALDAETGKPEWSFLPYSGSTETPIVAGGIIYGDFIAMPDDSTVEAGLYAFDARSGRKLWFFAPGGDVFAVVDGIIYVAEAGYVSAIQPPS